MVRSGKVTGSHLLGMALKSEGVRNIFTLAGDHILPVLDTFSDMDFHFVDTRHEQASVHMADAWGRITGEPGVCMYTTPGFAHALPGLAYALHSESPVISISGSAEMKELGRGAFQEINQVAMAAPMVKGSWLVQDARLIPHYIATAVRTAFSGRRGPVHLTIPVDVQEQTVSQDEMNFYRPDQHRSMGRVMPDPELVRQAVELLSQAQRPFVIAGGPAGYVASGTALQRFIETTRVPLFTEDNARGLVPDNHPYCFGLFARPLNRAARLMNEADVVVLLGRKQDYSLGYARPPAISASARIIQVDPSPTEIGRNRAVAVGIVSDIESALEALTKEASKHTWRQIPWLDRLRAERSAQAEQLETLAQPEKPAHAMFVHKTLGKLLRPDDILVFDGGDFCHFGRAFHPALRARGWLYGSTLGMLGASIPTALTAKLANPQSRVVVIIGDGSFGFNGMEFDTAVRHNLPIVAVVGNDAAWGIDRQIQLGIYGRSVITELLGSHYELVVQGLGGHGECVERPEELFPALERAFASGKPALVNVFIQGAISPLAEAAIAGRKARKMGDP